MPSFIKGTIVPEQPHHPNAFTSAFLSRLAERDEPPTAGDADVAGPWRVEPTPGHGFGRFQLFDEAAVDAMNVMVHLLQAPESLAYLLEAAGAVALDRCGAILDERTAAVP